MTPRPKKSPTEPAALEKVQQAFERLKITPPSIAARFQNELRPIGQWCFASRDISPGGMYMFDDGLLEGLAPETADYVAFSHAGHGVNSYALTYHLIDGPLVLMVQAGYGGGYSDEAQDRAAANAQFRRCDRLTAAVHRARQHGLPESGRLVVIESLLRRDFAWGWLVEPLSGTAAQDWLHQHTVRADAPTSGRVPEERLPTNVAQQWLEAGSFTPADLHHAGLTPPASVPRVYPEPRTRELTPEEKHQIRQRIAAGDADIFKLAGEFGCSASQVAGIKAWMKR